MEGFVKKRLSEPKYSRYTKKVQDKLKRTQAKEKRRAKARSAQSNT
jgi:hypothetical protein